MGRFTDADVDHYRTHGYALIENFLTPKELNDARDEIESIIPGWLEYAANPWRDRHRERFEVVGTPAMAADEPLINRLKRRLRRFGIGS